MKTNKLLILALPLLLAISACSPDTPKPSSQEIPSSSESSQEDPSSPTWEEEPMPTKTPAELQAEAEATFAAVSEILAHGEYFIELEKEQRYMYSCIGKGFFVSNYTLLSSDNKFITRQAGYMGNTNGVLRLRNYGLNSDNDFIYSTGVHPVGFALKTNTLEEAKAEVENISPRFLLEKENWTYLSNILETSNFKTTNEDVLDMFAFYDFNGLYRENLTAVYAHLNNDAKSLTLTAEGSSSQLTIYQLDSIRYTPRHDKSIRESDTPRPTAIANIIDEYEEKVFADDSWLDIQDDMFYFVRQKLPFPTEGNKYFFMDNERVVDSGMGLYPSHYGFIDTGDITTSYLTDLANSSQIQSIPGETNGFYAEWGSLYIKITTRFVPAAETENPSKYAKGIFYIDLVPTRNIPTNGN